MTDPPDVERPTGTDVVDAGPPLGSRRRVGRVATVFGVLVLVLTGTGTPLRTDAAGALGCATGPGDHVAVVIDFGDAPGAPPGVFATCVPKTAGMRTGLAALRTAAGGRLGQDSSTKICQIMGIPSTFDRANCSAPHNGRISYWAYFRGTGDSWTYSGAGAAAVPADPAIVEGWRFVTVPVSQQTSAAPPPRNFVDGASFRWQSTCPASPSPPATRPSRPSEPRPGGGGGAGPPVQTPGASGPVGGAVPPGSPRSGRANPEPTGPSTTTPKGSTTTTTKAPGSATTTPTVATNSTVAGTAGLRSSQTAPRLSDDEVTAAAEAAATSSGRPVGATVAGVVGGGGVVVALALVTRRSRRRRALAEATDPDGPHSS